MKTLSRSTVKEEPTPEKPLTPRSASPPIDEAGDSSPPIRSPIPRRASEPNFMATPKRSQRRNSLKAQQSFASLRDHWTEEEKKVNTPKKRVGTLFHGSTEGGLLGEGTFGSVVSGGFMATDSKLSTAVKRLTDREVANKELEIVEMLQDLEGSPYYDHSIMPILDVIWDIDEVFVCEIQMPHFDSNLGSFTRNFHCVDVVHRDDRTIIVDVWKNVWTGIGVALHYLSRHFLFHGDVKGDNIMLKEADRKAVLGDTGSIKDIRHAVRGLFTDNTASPETYSFAVFGTVKLSSDITTFKPQPEKKAATPCLYWLAGFRPESPKYLLNDDIFSFGIVMLEMWSRSFHNKNYEQAFWIDFLRSIDKFGAPLLGVCINDNDEKERREAVIKWLNDYLRQFIGCYVPKVFRSLGTEVPLYLAALKAMTEADYTERQRFNAESRSFLESTPPPTTTTSTSTTPLPERGLE